MKIKKKIILLFSSIIILPTLIISCSKKQNIEKNSIIIQENKNGVREISMCIDKDKATTESLINELKKLQKNKEVLDNNKALLVKFYEYQDEAYFSDLIPYAIGFWGPSTGLESSYNQISSKNNKFFVKFNTEKDTEIYSEDIDIYKELLINLKLNDNKKSNIQQELMFYLANNENIDTFETKKILDKFINRFENDAIKDVIVGNLE